VRFLQRVFLTNFAAVAPIPAATICFRPLLKSGDGQFLPFEDLIEVPVAVSLQAFLASCHEIIFPAGDSPPFTKITTDAGARLSHKLLQPQAKYRLF
jgi:hypothetical protein